MCMNLGSTEKYANKSEFLGPTALSEFVTIEYLKYLKPKESQLP